LSTGPSGQRADARRNRARILAAAEEVFAEQGPAASTEEVAARAGLAIGTIFRHFPTKQELLRAIMKDLLQQLTERAAVLAASGNPSIALQTFFTETVQQAARKRPVIELLGQAGVDVQMTAAVEQFRTGVSSMLTLAQQAGTVRDDVDPDDVIALLATISQGAAHSSWSPDRQQRTLMIIFRGLSRGPDQT
jgi:AcrR family transcriptional regulator